MKFNYAEDEDRSNKEAEYLGGYGKDFPSITAQGNLTYLQFIDLVQRLWNRANPEVHFVPFAASHIWDRENGYIVYSLETRRTHNGNAKPKVHKVIDDPNDSTRKIIIYLQSFDNIVKFTALHQDPRTAEELIESFEDFMIEISPLFVKFGAEHVFYNRRYADEHDTRYGNDIASRITSYMVVTQKILSVDVTKLEEIATSISITTSEPSATPLWM